jgi:hypothetical protein
MARDRRGAIRPRLPTWSSALGLFLAAMLLGGCDEHITDAVLVTNNTGSPLHFQLVLVDGRPFDLVTIAKPGETIRLLAGSQLSDDSGMTKDRCTVGELRAIDPNGRVVQRLPPPICATTTVVIGGVPGST